ncbi:esterase-like activity of phytase family protein [Marinobacterium jannaschii]|uniref:esterase-like activity of phytase family protein n=1 Tax=Marinobacterium jannaschii TaxID=64970 RepID=UPI00047FC0E0|nr:esterase-like activity of phytase family protein [Marinobacterium jannaschii]
MFNRTFRRSALAIMVAAAATGAQADAFNRIASFSTIKNLPANSDIKTETSAEIIDVSEDGKTLVYSDSPLEGLGIIDISDADEPEAKGFIKTAGEPTSVAFSGDYVLAGINTSESYTQPSGFLAAIDLDDRKIEKQCDLGGQPDSVAVSKDGKFVAVAIENERDEDLGEGVLPQLPAGFLVIAPLEDGKPECDEMRRVELTGLAEIGGEDPEPEFVDFNGNNEIVVTLQENNHLVIVDAETGKVINHFSAGGVDLQMVDLTKDKALSFDKTQQNRLREPDSVKWLDNDRFVTANEGDMNGGARGFTIFHKDGRVLFESGAGFEHEVIMAGHYPEKRSGKKGNEPEGLAVGKFGKDTYIFVLSERGGAIGVYRDTGAAPEFMQLLPSGIGPESAVAIPSRNLLVSANEKDLIEDKGPRSHVMVYKLNGKAASYPQIKSGRNAAGQPIGWGALSGLTADHDLAGKLYAVNDSFYATQPTIFTIDANQSPAKITSALPVTRNGKPAEKLDLEGIALDGKGGFWLASEGKTKKKVPHAIYHVNAQGEIDRTLNFPEALLKHEKRFGSEGITVIGDSLWIAIQRQWKDDPANTVKLVSYNLKTDTWGAVRYPTEAASTGWVGLSEITAHEDEVYIIERDNQIGENAKIKRLYKIEQSELKPAPLGGELPVVKKELVRDFIPDLMKANGYVTDKIEGFTIDASGKGYAVTDNDGVDDSSGETFFFTTGKM